MDIHVVLKESEDESIQLSDLISIISKSTGMPISHLTTELAGCIGNGLSLEDALLYIFDHNF